jgi:hypothetical protein
MPRPLANPVPLHLPPGRPDLNSLPVYSTAVQLEKIGNRYFGQISAHTIRNKWPLKWHEFNGRSVASTAEFIDEAQRRFA